MTKGLESLLNNSGGDLGVELDLDELVFKAFKMVLRAAKFLDVWEEHMQSVEISVKVAKNICVPPTPPADRTEFGLPEHNHGDSSVPVSQNARANTEGARDFSGQTRAPPRYNRSSQTFVRPGSSNSCRQSSNLANKGPTSHRTSCIVHPGSRILASERLGALHNAFLTSLGYFIGLHIQSRSSTEILLTTKQSVVSCRDLLELAGEIWERDWRRSVALQDARDSMHRKIADLADAARDLFKPFRSGEADEVLMSTEGRPLVEAATACVRAAGECIAESRLVIERIGDFEFESFGLGISENVVEPAPDALSAVEEDQVSTTAEDFPIPPAPVGDPPPPPVELVENPFLSAATTYAESVDELAPLNVVETPESSAVPLLLPPLAPISSLLLSSGNEYTSQQSLMSSAGEMETAHGGHVRRESIEASSNGDSSTSACSMRVSQSSTRATSPDATFVTRLEYPSYCNHEAGSQSTLFVESEQDEVEIMEKTFAHELIFNKDGQISGGTLPALIERLTTHDSTPDATFVSTFYLTFRLFATPTEFAQALIDRFQYVGESPRIASPVRLRVYNVFKGWLESHWRSDCDIPALELILSFATRQLQIVLPTAGKRLASLAEKVTAVNGPLVPRLISSMGKTNTSIALYVSPDSPLPAPIISKSQMAALRSWKHGGANIGILDFDPLELARQFTIKESQIFCSILPEELLATEWMKKSGSMAVNVRAMSRLSTDLANLVADCILQLEDPKRRAAVIKQWVKIANKFLEMANYDSLMAIICSLESSTILRLKRTWEMVSSKTKATLEHLKSVVDISKNYAILRQRLQNHVPPCLPFVGTYLTDLTFVDIGNQTSRQLPGDGLGETQSVINFDKHMKTARIISDLQRFQIPYRFTEIPELQTWMQDQLVRVRTSDESSMQNHYRRSLLLEPRELVQGKLSPVESQASISSTKERFELFGLGKLHYSKEKVVTRPTTPT